jgi:hypothetical protein
MKINYLKIKNRVFMKIFKKLWKEEQYNSIYYMKGGSGELNEIYYDDYYDILGLYFYDEEGYLRAMFMPLPLIPKKYREILKDYAWKDIIYLCDRSWHDIMPKPVIPDDYRPHFFYDKYMEYNEEEYDENDEEIDEEGIQEKI